MTAQAAHPVIELERQRCDALVAGDLERVAAMLAPELVYVHAPGTVHDRTACLAFWRTSVRYRTVERAALSVHAHDDITWTTGLMRITGDRLPSGEPLQATSFVSQVWRREGTHWLLALLQSTKVDEALWRAYSGLFTRR